MAEPESIYLDDEYQFISVNYSFKVMTSPQDCHIGTEQFSKLQTYNILKTFYKK